MQQRPSTVMIGRVLYWGMLAVSLFVIYLVPSRAAQPPVPVLYPLLLILSIADLAFMKYMDYKVMQAVANQKATPRPQAAPIILASFGVAPAVYGLLWHFLGGTRTQSSSFVLISILGYVLFSILLVKYDSLPSDNSGQ